MLAKIFKKNMDVTMCDILKLFQASDPLSHFILRPLHLNIYVLRSALRCWSLLTFIGQFWHNKSTVEAT